MDTVSQLLQTFRLQAEVFHNAKYCNAFNIDTTVSGKAGFHLITEGQAYVVFGDAREPETLAPGDLVLLPRAGEHRVVDALDTSAPVNGSASARFGDVADQAGTGLVCGYLTFDHPASNPLMDALPDVVIVRASGRPADCNVRELLHVLVRESVSDQPGVQVTLNRLCDVVFVLVMREYLGVAGGRGVAAALADKRIGRALDALHANLAADWSVESLAGLAAMSRAGFAARFKALLDTTPVAYLTAARMQSAYRLLKDHQEPVAAVAAQVGYATEAAFAKAFKRELGIAPGAVRRGTVD
ncbi:MAG: AraC family transcriptional regulator [Pseudomonadota bacterium]